jgi:hypothetical protein
MIKQYFAYNSFVIGANNITDLSWQACIKMRYDEHEERVPFSINMPMRGGNDSRWMYNTRHDTGCENSNTHCTADYKCSRKNRCIRVKPGMADQCHPGPDKSRD